MRQFFPQAGLVSKKNAPAAGLNKIHYHGNLLTVARCGKMKSLPRELTK